MITLITGTPGAGKSLLSVWEFAKGVPGSFIEENQTKVPRVLYSNIKDLLVEHVHISADDLNTWHEWAKPGAVILFDEVQEVWRPRSMGVKVPECIAALETHRHMGVDLVFVTQHPMLLDMNIRRLVNQHLHLRRMTRTTAMVYEWDRCANPQQTKDCLHSRVWFHPKKAYALYKSAQLHTKPTARIPKVAILGVLALCGLVYLVPTAYARLTGSMGVPEVAKSKIETNPVVAAAFPSQSIPVTAMVPLPPVSIPGSTSLDVLADASKAPIVAGCIATAKKCACVDSSGLPAVVEAGYCESRILGNAVPGQKLELSPAFKNISDLADISDSAEKVAMDLSVYAFLGRHR